MHYSQITVTVYMLHDIKYTQSFEIIGSNINKAMLLDNELSSIHHMNRFKNYIFNSFYPTEVDKVYKAGRIYIFNIRTIDDLFAEKISNLLKRIQSSDFKIISTESIKLSKRIITELYTITPVIITNEGNKNWTLGDKIDLFWKRLNDNLEKKYNNFYQDKIKTEDVFFERIEFLNKKPISLEYKNTHLLGNKLKLFVKYDEQYQKMAFVAEAIGLGEKGSSVGAGFCNAQYLK